MDSVFWEQMFMGGGMLFAISGTATTTSTTKKNCAGDLHVTLGDKRMTGVYKSSWKQAQESISVH